MIRVVLVDDADDLRLLVRLHLSADPRFDVVAEARDGHEAIALLATQSHDVVLLDLAMPRMDGLEVLQHLRTRADRTPVVVFSGFASPAMAHRALELGAAAYVQKGDNLDRLTDALAAAALAAS